MSRILAPALVAAASCAAAGQGIRPDSLPDTRIPIEELIRRLDAGAFDVREQATLDLERREDLSLAMAESMLSEPGLTSEQRLRLERVSYTAFGRGPWAAVGIQFSPSETGGQRITDTVAGFDAARVLQRGDVIVAADGQPVFSQRSLRAAILCREPGGVMRMDVLRAGQRMEVQFRLGSFAQLSSPMTPVPGDLSAAWLVRRSRAKQDVPADALIPTPDVESMPEYTPSRGSAAWEEAFASPDAPASLVVGGQAREGIDLSLEQLVSVEAARRDAVLGPSGDLVAQRAVLREERGVTLAQIAAVQRHVQMNDLDEHQLAQVQFRLGQLADRLRELEDQIRALDEVVPDRPRP